MWLLSDGNFPARTQVELARAELEDDRDQALPEDLGRALHEHVHGGFGPPLAVHPQVYLRVGDVDVLTARAARAESPGGATGWKNST